MYMICTALSLSFCLYKQCDEKYYSVDNNLNISSSLQAQPDMIERSKGSHLEHDHDFIRLFTLGSCTELQ